MSGAHRAGNGVSGRRAIRSIAVVAAVAWCGGFLTATVPALAYTKLNAWRAYGETFQLGYVVGFLDAVTLWKRRDPRGATIPIGGKQNFELWRSRVNDYFADPENEKRTIPDAMGSIGSKLTMERLKAYNERAAATPGAAPTPAEPAAAPHHDAPAAPESPAR